MSINKNYSSVPFFTMLSVHEGDDGAAATAAAAAEAARVAQQKLVDDAVAAATAGLKAKNDELLGSVRSLKDAAKSFEGIDPVAVKAMLTRMEQDEDLKLLAEGKSNLVIERHTERMRAQHTSELAAKDELVRAEAARADAYRGSVLDNQIRAVTSGLHKGAVDDALLHARNIFTLDAKGNAVQLGSDGRPVLGKDGATPFSPAEWIEMQKELKPHWFPANTSGSGSGPAREASGSGKTMKRADFEKLPGHEQATVARSGTKITD